MNAPTEAEMNAIIAADAVIISLRTQAEAHYKSEVARTDDLRKRISETWGAVRDMKRQRGELTRAIANRIRAIHSMARNTRIRTSLTLKRRIAARKVTLRRREENRLARVATREAVREFRKRMGIPPGGVG